MDWLRRNWPDLLIGIALVAVIAGIIATLITGGSFFSIGEPTIATTPVAPSVPTVEAPQTAIAVAPDPVATGAQPQSDAPLVAAPDPAPQADSGPTVSVLPPTDNAAPATTVAPTTPAPEVSPEAVVVAPSLEPATPAAPVAVVAVSELPTPSADPTAPFRVSVGAFSTLENAERQADSFRAAGYPVLIGAQGSLSLVLIGPYQQRSDADRVAAQIAAAGLFEEPLIYTFESDDTAPAAAATPAPAATPAATPTPVAAAGERFIQVGAYGSDESAAPQRERVTGLGFAVSSQVEGGLVKLLIGPLSDQQLLDAQARLEAEGIANFVR
jgi:cell division septation protein DedD